MNPALVVQERNTRSVVVKKDLRNHDCIVKERHHYLSKFYLKGFIDQSNPPYIWIYEKGNSLIRKATATDIAVKKHYYSFTSVTGARDSETYENALAEIEDYAAPVFKKIVKQENLGEEERISFATFLAITMLRVPYFREKFRHLAEVVTKRRLYALATDPEVFQSYLREFDLQSMIKNQQELSKIIAEGNYKLRISSQISLEIMPKLAIKLVVIFDQMNWHFLISNEKMSFVTCDNPVVYHNQMLDTTVPSNRGFVGGLLNKHTEISFPVSHNIVFLGTWGRLLEYRNHDELKLKHTKEMNHRTIFSAVRFVFASKKSSSLSEVVQRYKDAPPNKDATTKWEDNP